MLRPRFTITGTAVLLALALACSRQPGTPVSPTAPNAAGADAAADGSTLKASAPTPTSPVNDAAVSSAPTLTSTASSLKFGGAATLTYRFQVFNPAGAMIQDSGARPTPSFPVTANMDFKVRHTWRVRAEMGTDVGPWSSTASFISPEGGYIRGNEVFDPLYNGVTVGQIVGSVTFSGDGARLDNQGSYVRYVIPQTITTGEFAVEIKGLRPNAPGDKSKVFGMMEGSPDNNDYITNRYRVDVQYRGTNGSPPNAITYRVIYGDADDLGVRYEPLTDTRNNSVRILDPNTYYYWRYTWGKTVRVTVQTGGPTGPVIYDVTRNSTNGSYNPQPHYAFIGAPAGRSGIEAATIPGTIYRNVWISTRPRP